MKSANQRLSAMEASFLALERPGLPMHIAAVVLIEAPAAGQKPLSIDDLRHLVSRRLSRAPRFHQRVRFAPLGLARAEWVPAGRIALADHLFHHRLPAKAGRSHLDALYAQIQESLLPRDRPLWQMHLIDGLAGHRQALIVKTHHAITDGIGGMELAKTLLEPLHGHGQPPGGTVAVPRFACPIPSANSWLQAVAGIAFTAARGPVALRSPFNGRVGRRRAFGMATLSMDKIRLVKLNLGLSIDDVFLATVAGGLRRYFRQSGLAAPRAMKAMLPASTRRASATHTSGNHVTAVFVDLPLDSHDLAKVAGRIAMSKGVLKTVHAGLGMSALVEAVGLLPPPLHDATVRIAGNLPGANLVVSDIPGPAEPQYLMGRRIVACYPMLPLGGAIGVSIAAISMGGTMGVGVTADPDLLPHPERLARAIADTLDAFEAGLPRAQTGRQDVRARRARAA